MVVAPKMGVLVLMKTALSRCLHCGRLFGASYESHPPSRADLVCACGAAQFETVDPEDVVKAGS